MCDQNRTRYLVRRTQTPVVEARACRNALDGGETERGSLCDRGPLRQRRRQRGERRPR